MLHSLLDTFWNTTFGIQQGKEKKWKGDTKSN